ncbi:MAG TPA: ABC transporter substrate-binding protein [bacterium]|nr:ABC transporter substrate-binding protein [bacterium]
MQIFKIATIAAAAAAVIVFGFSAYAQKSSAPAKRYYPEGTPTRAIQALDDMLDDFITKPKGQNLTPQEESHNRELKKKILHGTFDIRELARLSLAKHWNARTEAERSRFVGLLTDLLEEKALFSKEQSASKSKSGGKYFVVYRGEKFDNPNKSRAFVRTKVVIPSENIDISLNYRVKKASGEWKIFDIVVDEASLVENYKFQFDSIIKKHGYPDLVRRMQSKLSDIRADRTN